MQLWTLPGPPPTLPSQSTRTSSRAMAAQAQGMALNLIGCIGQANFGQTALACINTAVAAASWSVYSLSSHRAPVLHTSGAFDIEDTTTRCFKVYEDGLYRHDATFDEAHEKASDERHVMTHWHAHEIGRRHSDRIYRQHGMRERLSIAARDDDGSLLAVNLYRHQHEPGFAAPQIQLLQASARTLLACVRQHIRLRCTPAPLPAAAASGISRLQARCPQLTPRELQVCEALLRGLTYDGIAVDLGLSVTTAKTYRNRAFARLGIHFRSELYALAMADSQPLS